MDKSASLSFFWFRRDLRLHDNHGLYQALQKGLPVQCVFIFDAAILDKLEREDDSRVSYIHTELKRLDGEMQQHGGSLVVRYGEVEAVWKELLQSNAIQNVYCNHDYEPYAIQRDKKIKQLVEKQGCSFYSYKDHIVFEKAEVVKDDGTPYTVFTPYSRKWKKHLAEVGIVNHPSDQHLNQLHQTKPYALVDLKTMGFVAGKHAIPEKGTAKKLLENYHKTRDIPSIEGTSRMGVHLRFGTVSIRQLVKQAQTANETYLNELIWRDFYAMVLWHFPHVVKGSFRSKYDRIEWRNSQTEFDAWRAGKTGYPIVDAGMRELKETGHMHNRVRMIVASFLTKHLLIDWRLGEAHFASFLLDFDLASNNGGWQWAAGSGCDAAPYFRVFNPYLQTKKFDPELKYIKQWVPEFDDPFAYPQPIVDHKFARERALATYKSGLNAAK